MNEIIAQNAAIIVAVTGAVVVILALMGWRVRVSKRGVQTERDVPGRKKLPQHASCPHRMPIISLIRKVFYAGKFFGQFPYAVLHQQMDAYDEYEAEVYSALLDDMSELMTNNDIDDPENHHDFFEFEKIIHLMLEEAALSVRKWFKSNHYAEKNPDEQAEYINSKRDIIVQNGIRYIKRTWNGDTISKADLVDMIEDRKTRWYSRIESLFRTAFSISREQARIRKETFETITKECEELFGESSKILSESDL